MVKIIFAVCLFAFVVLPETGHAALVYSGTPITLATIQMWVEDIVFYLFEIGGVVAAGFIVWSGIKWATSGGDASKASEAKDMLKTSIIGGLIVLGVGVVLATIVRFVSTLSLT